MRVTLTMLFYFGLVFGVDSFSQTTLAHVAYVPKLYLPGNRHPPGRRQYH